MFANLLPTLLRLWPNETVRLWVNNLNLHLVLGYVGYYVLGYYLKTYTLNRAAEYLIYLLGILGAVVTVGGTAWLSQQRGTLVQTLYNYDSPNIALMSVAVFVFFRYVLGVSEERSPPPADELGGAGVLRGVSGPRLFPHCTGPAAHHRAVPSRRCWRCPP